MPINIKKNRREEAWHLRKKGWSYSEIGHELALSKSTVASWVKRLHLSGEQLTRLAEKRRTTGIKNLEKRSRLAAVEAVRIHKKSADSIGSISRREFWLLGIMLLWRESDPVKGLHFSSANPDLIHLFLRWLQDIGGLKKDEIFFDIFLRDKELDEQRTIDFWSEKTGFPKEYFTRSYQQKGSNGFLRVRVRASSMLARQVRGWIAGVIKHL